MSQHTNCGDFFDPRGAHSAVCACRWWVPVSQGECCAGWVAEEMVVAGSRGHLPSAVSRCSIPKQHSALPFLPTQLVCRQGNSAWLLFSQLGDPVQGSAARGSLGWRADVMAAGCKRGENPKCRCALESLPGSVIYLCGVLLLSVVLWQLCD